MKKLSGIFMGVLLAFATGGIAGAGTGPGTKPVAANIFGTGMAADPIYVDTSTGACNVSGWVDACPASSGNVASCECITLASPRITNRKLSVTNIFFTIVDSENPATQSAVNGGPNPGCNLMLGTADLADNTGGSETLNFLGTTCKHVIAITSANPGGTNDKDILSGGWGISADPASNPSQSGWGTFSGMVIDKTLAVTLHLQGWDSK